MSDKDYKRLMQCLLVACAFVIVLLYLYFTKGACLEMNKSSKIFTSIFLGIVSVLLILFIVWGYYTIWSNKKQCSTVFCYADKSVFYIQKDCKTVPDGVEKVLLFYVDALENFVMPASVKDVYILNPTGKVSAETLERFGSAKIHFCKVGKKFCIEKIIKNESDE